VRRLQPTPVSSPDLAGRAAFEVDERRRSQGAVGVGLAGRATRGAFMTG
jgi:hypothetical protein